MAIVRFMAAVWRWAGNISTAQWVWSVTGGAVTAFATWLAEQPPYLVLFYGLAAFALVMIALHKLQMILHVKERRAAQAAESPIFAFDQIHADCDQVTDEIGGLAQDLYSVSLCLQVTNRANDARTLRDARARVYSRFGDISELPFRGAKSDLRHGELELVEVGRVLMHWPNSLPVMVRGGERHQASLADINYAFNPNADIRSLRTSGGNLLSFGQMEGAPRSRIPLTITASDTPARELELELNLWDNDPYKWLVVHQAGAVK